MHVDPAVGMDDPHPCVLKALGGKPHEIRCRPDFRPFHTPGIVDHALDHVVVRATDREHLAPLFDRQRGWILVASPIAIDSSRSSSQRVRTP